MVFAQENSSISLTQLFPGQYDNTKFYITLADPEGIGAATVNKVNGDWVLGAGRSCLKQFNTGTVTLLPKDFPLKASLTDCKGNKYETSIFPLGTFPVAELGNCANEKECEAYCQKPENMGPCLDFAEENDLLPEEEIAIARKMLSAGETSGPGGCRGQAECEAYCDDISHIRECVTFAEEHDLMPPEELEEARKVADAIDRGIQLPPCSSKTECDDVCRLPENMRACITFAKEAGLMPAGDLEEAEKVLAALEKGIQPPPCGGKDECDEYCALPENFETCITFAEAAGFMSAEEAAMVRRTGGKGPGDCRGKDACEAYCEDPAHGDECINFAIENGFMSAEEGEQAKKMLAAGMNVMQGGPGGCKGREECDAYCDDFTHMTDCVDFAEKAGMMSPEDAARARRMAEKGINMMQGGPGGCKGQEECEAFCNEPANMEECLNFAVQIGDMEPEEAERARQGMQMRAQMAECLSMPCSEALPCLQALSPQGPPEGQGEQPAEPPPEGGEGDEIRQKIELCMREMMPEGPPAGEAGMMPPEGFEGQMPPEGMGPEQFQEQFQRQMEQMQPPEMTPGGDALIRPDILQQQIEQQIQQQIEQQMQQQIQQQMEQQMQQQFAPPPTEPVPPPPESFFESVKNFLATLIPII